MSVLEFPALEHGHLAGVALTHRGEALEVFRHVGDTLAVEPKILLNLDLLTIGALEEYDSGASLQGSAFMPAQAGRQLAGIPSMHETAATTVQAWQASATPRLG